MNHKPLISVVTPCRNNVRFIKGCIDSVQTQDYPNVEHIVQDGASTDGTVDILRQYNRCVDWISEPDKGQSDGLNRALQRSHGDIIIVLNADDELLPYACSWAVKQLEHYPEAAVIYGDQYNIDENGQILSKTYGPDPYDFKKILCVEEVIPAQAAFIRRSCFESVGFYADVRRPTCPDYEMWIRIGLKYPMRHVFGFTARYRWHEDSEGRQTQIIYKMVKSKREAMNRVFFDKNTRYDIKILRRRAYAGVILWGAHTLISNGEMLNALPELIKAFKANPSLRQMFRVLSSLYSIVIYFFYYFRRLIKKYLLKHINISL